MPNKKNVVAGSGSVAKDLQLPDAQEADIKAQLAARLMMLIQERGLSQTDAAAIIGTDQSKVSAILNGRYRGFSIYRLISFLKAFDQDVEIAIRPKADREARVCVIAD